MEKRGVIEPGRTPPEAEKQAEQLEEHVTRRAADAVKDQRQREVELND